MISLSHARALRARMVQLASTLSDADAIEVPELFPMWRTGTAYLVGNRRQHEGVLYTCVQAHTSQDDWTPNLTPALWKVTTPEGVIPEWVQPTGAHDAYAIGDKVTHNGSTWVSTIDANTYEPGAYGWDEVTE